MLRFAGAALDVSCMQRKLELHHVTFHLSIYAADFSMTLVMLKPNLI